MLSVFIVYPFLQINHFRTHFGIMTLLSLMWELSLLITKTERAEFILPPYFTIIPSKCTEVYQLFY